MKEVSGVKKTGFVLFLLIFCILSNTWAVQPDTPKVVLETNFGEIVIELLPDDAPITVANFLQYVNSGYYDNTVFHRVVNNEYFSIIQSGGIYVRNNTLYMRPPGGPIVNESYNGLSNLRGTIAMARTTAPDSATAQFFINQTDNTLFDRANYPDGYGYCVFGNVINGMDSVDQIAAMDTINVGGGLTDFPYPPLVEIYQANTCMYVAANGDDTTGIGTPDEPFRTIQKAVDTISPHGQVILKPGTYTGLGNRDIDLNGKPVLVTSINPYLALNIETTIIDCQGSQPQQHRAFLFDNGEDANSVLQGLTITGGFIEDGAAIYCNNSSPAIKNCIITDNHAANDAGAIYCFQSAPIITNCIFTANSAANHGGSICSKQADPLISGSIFTGNTAPYGPDFAILTSTTPSTLNLSFNNIRTGRNTVHFGSNASLIWGPGNINVYSHFVDTQNADYHLKSQYRRWDKDLADWTDAADTVTSRCIDAENPALYLAFEPEAYTANNIRINMGAYGGTAKASPALANWALLADLTNDGIVNFADFLYFAQDWLQTSVNNPADLNTDGTVDFDDHAKLASLWHYSTRTFSLARGDFNIDGIVNLADYSAFASDWKKTTDGLTSDLNSDGAIDESDLRLFADSWLK
jgi:peptidyl-prolyl cis-trans isomerase A (cyclophilin A)/peptidyl-prolyl cis-trans isomerase B (cyclophilin B)